MYQPYISISSTLKSQWLIERERETERVIFQVFMLNRESYLQKKIFYQSKLGKDTLHVAYLFIFFIFIYILAY